jgi:hypothetical protein
MARTKKSRRRSASSRQGRMFGDMAGIASTVTESSKHLAAERLTDLATATRHFTTSFEDLPYLRDYTDAAAQKIGELAEYVTRTDIPDMLEDVASLAKRRPMATLALSVAAGLVTTQLVRGWPTVGSGASRGSSVEKSGRKRSVKR